jgi:hypothetical protein
MAPLSLQQLARLDDLLASGTAPPAAFPQAIGGTCLCDGIWRFFSDSWPEGGISRWNNESLWKVQWQARLPLGLFSLGEDVFGNQLVLVSGHENVILWNHEDGECHDLLLGPCELLRTAQESGIDWIDFYSDGSLAVARQHSSVPLDSHLHWTTPLILGGQVTSRNISLVRREPHLVGHAKLWSQVGDLPPGTTIIAR